MNLFKTKKSGSNSPITTPKNEKKTNLNEVKNESGIKIISNDPNTPKIKEQNLDEKNLVNEVRIDMEGIEEIKNENLLDTSNTILVDVKKEEDHEPLEVKQSKINFWEILGKMVNQASQKIVEEEEKISSGSNTPEIKEVTTKKLELGNENLESQKKTVSNEIEEINTNEVKEEKIEEVVKKDQLDEEQKQLVERLVKNARLFHKAKKERESERLKKENEIEKVKKQKEDRILRLSKKKDEELSNVENIELKEVKNENEESKVLIDEDRVNQLLEQKIAEFFKSSTEEVKEEVKNQRGMKIKSQKECNQDIINKMGKKVSEELVKVKSPEKKEVDPHEQELAEALKLISELIEKNKRLSLKMDQKPGGFLTSVGETMDDVFGGGQTTGNENAGDNQNVANTNTTTTAPSTPTELLGRVIKRLWNSGFKCTAIGGLVGFLIGTYVLGSVIKSLFTTLNSNITDATAKALVESLESLGGGVILTVVGMLFGLPIDGIIWCVNRRWIAPERRQRRETYIQVNNDLTNLLNSTQSATLQEAVQKMIQNGSSQMNTPNGVNQQTNLLNQDNLNMV